MFILKSIYTLFIVIAMWFAIAFATCFLKNKEHRYSETFNKRIHKLLLMFIIFHICGSLTALTISIIDLIS